MTTLQLAAYAVVTFPSVDIKSFETYLCELQAVYGNGDKLSP